MFVLVFILASVWSVLDFLSALTAQKDQNLKGIVTEKYQIPSQMKPSHLQGIKDLIAEPARRTSGRTTSTTTS